MRVQREGVHRLLCFFEGCREVTRQNGVIVAVAPIVEEISAIILLRVIMLLVDAIMLLIEGLVVVIMQSMQVVKDTVVFI